MFFIFLIDFSLAHKDVIKGLFNQHVQNVIILMFKQQTNQPCKKSYLANPSQYTITSNRYAMTQHLQQLIVVQVHLRHHQNAVHRRTEHIHQLVYHRLTLQLLQVLSQCLGTSIGVI